ncbi:hypothetical protein DNTS_021168 [Danionella cerebrum]|uniref:Sodium channel regulatory subunit beta-3 n=1 Tax=Danionella cerebrum TaxID=2873325 RepID=A0A553R1J5_9TELE|nr:hypothetical protein DNTS_021168 [Danionella translucida]
MPQPIGSSSLVFSSMETSPSSAQAFRGYDLNIEEGCSCRTPFRAGSEPAVTQTVKLLSHHGFMEIGGDSPGFANSAILGSPVDPSKRQENSTPHLIPSLCSGACVEVDSDTEAVTGGGFKLTCISCKMRGEVPASATVDWWFMAKGDNEFAHIYSYEDMKGYIMDDRFADRLAWNGSKKTVDVQDGSIFILNVTFNDTGTFRCFFDRTLAFPNYEYRTNATKFITINVVGNMTRGMASILSEIMMYVSIIGLQLWLVVEMVYCYRKIAAAGEEALRESE